MTDLPPDLREQLKAYPLDLLLDDKHERLRWEYMLRPAELLNLAGDRVLVPIFAEPTLAFSLVRSFAQVGGDARTFELRRDAPSRLTGELRCVLIVAKRVPEQEFWITTIYHELH
jgi:hypothetical protein